MAVWVTLCEITTTESMFDDDEKVMENVKNRLQAQDVFVEPLTTRKL